MGYSNVYGVPAWTAAREVEPRRRARVIDGRAVAARLRTDIARDVEAFTARTGRRPGLATVLIGDDPASALYVGAKQNACRAVGIEPFDVRLPANAAPDDAETAIARLNQDDRVDGVLCQLPVPGHLDGVHLAGLIATAKDVDGLTRDSAGLLALGRNGLRPCTPAGVMVLLDEAGAELRGAEAVVVGRSNLFGKPMAQLLLAADATVTVAHSHTRGLADVCRRADVLVVAVGRACMIRGSWIKTGAVVIDVGMNRTADGVHGDVAFDEASERAEAITPVPGGVGPVTIAMLLRNTMHAAERSGAAS
jgi:methylenetetrahydrofolate dehydrogenase (NADP+)/methenyltetrahydrofolate cyclohydrolase